MTDTNPAIDEIEETLAVLRHMPAALHHIPDTLARERGNYRVAQADQERVRRLIETFEREYRAAIDEARIEPVTRLRLVSSSTSFRVVTKRT